MYSVRIPMVIIFALIGLFLGTVINGFDFGFFLSLQFGAIGALIKMHRRVGKQEEKIESLRTAIKNLRIQPMADAPAASPPPKLDSQKAAKHVVEGLAKQPIQRPKAPIRQEQEVSEPSAFQRQTDAAVEAIREFFMGGNTVVRVGLLVLLVGVVLLLKYAAEHSLFPIEMRMASAAVIGMALVAIGFRKHKPRPGFGTTLQGGGVAVLYLVVFFSFQKYELIPAALAFGLLGSIAFNSGILAVVQNSLALILISITFGFLAPILASTGSGNHVALFSYYTVLNLLIVGVAWYRSWRPLNLLGFCFTFGIGTVWGVLEYDQSNFASTEPFLIGFFLMYVAIVAIFAWRRPAKLRGWVDGSLTFGVPLAVLALQYQLVKDRDFGMAFTAAGMAAVYLMTASFLFKKAPQAMRNLTEAFLVLGVGFATLAVPYGFSNQSLTGATWAIEGAGLFWIGCKQGRTLSRITGVALQFLAGIAFMAAALRHSYPSDALAILNVRFAAAMLLALSGLGVALLAHRKRDKLHKPERFCWLLIPWATLWWYIAWFTEIGEHVNYRYQDTAVVALIGLSCLLFERLGKRLEWTNGRLPALLSVPALFILVLSVGLDVHPLNPNAGWSQNPAAIEFFLSSNPFEFGGWLAWPLFVLIGYSVLFRLSKTVGTTMPVFHAVWHFGVVALVALSAGFFVRLNADLIGSWSIAALGVGIIAAFAVTARLIPRIADSALRAFYQRIILGGVAIALFTWHLRTGLMASGEGGPIGYLPVLNPIDLTLGFAFLACLYWLRRCLPKATWVLGPLAFLWFNGVLARTAFHQHQNAIADLANQSFHYDLMSLWNLDSLQLAYSVSWAMIGLATILIATRKVNRNMWMMGGGLLAVVVLKLFLVDLKELGKIEMIISFLVVGALLLVVGYFSPMPPSEPKPEEPAESEIESL